MSRQRQIKQIGNLTFTSTDGAISDGLRKLRFIPFSRAPLNHDPASPPPSLLQRVAGMAPYAAMIGILYWRLGKDQFFPDVIVAVSVARLALIPVFLLLKPTP